MSNVFPALALVGETCQAENGIWKCWFFWGEGKTNYPEINLSAQRREPTLNSTHIWRSVRESNPGNIGGRRALLPLRYPCYPGFVSIRFGIQKPSHFKGTGRHFDSDTYTETMAWLWVQRDKLVGEGKVRENVVNHVEYLNWCLTKLSEWFLMGVHPNP